VVYTAVGSSLREPTGRVLKSIDSGSTWADTGRHFVISGNSAWRTGGERLAVDPINSSVVFFGTRTEGLWSTVDAGATWQSLVSPRIGPALQGDPAGVGFVVFDPSSPVIAGRTTGIYAGVEGVGILRSDDAGVSWRTVYSAPNSIPLNAQIGSDGRLFVVVGGPSSTVVRVASAGLQTKVIAPKTQRYGAIAVDPRDPNRLFLGAEGVRNGALWRSTDGGDTWTALNISITSPTATWPIRAGIDSWMATGALAFDPTEPDTLWFAQGSGMWRSIGLKGNQVTWSFTSDGIEELVATDVLKPTGRPLLTAAWDRGVFSNSASGARAAMSTRFNSAWDLAISSTDSKFVVAVVDDMRGACCTGDGLGGQSGYSADGGVTWSRFASLVSGTHPADLRFGNIAVSAGNNRNMVWLPSENGRVYSTTDGGRTWTPAAYPGKRTHSNYYLRRHVLTADPLTPGTFYAFDQNGVVRSTDGGATWTFAANKGAPPGWARSYNATLTAVPGRARELMLSLGSLQGATLGMFHSTDGGDTWAAVPSIASVATFGFGKPSAPNAPPVVFAAGSVDRVAGIWRSDDLGQTWRQLSGNPAGRYQTISTVAGDPDVIGKVYLGYSGLGFLVGEPP
jgi:hypothetical protein